MKLNSELEVLPLVLVVRGLVSLAVVLAMVFMFPGAFVVVNGLPFAPTLGAANSLVGLPEKLAKYGALFGFLTLRVLLITSTGQFVLAGEAFFRVKIGRRVAVGRWARRAAYAYMAAGFLENAAALDLIAQLGCRQCPISAKITLAVSRLSGYSA